MSNSNYKISTELIKDKSLVIVEIAYKDDFTNDKYTLKGWVNDNVINFKILKNNKQNLNESKFYSNNTNNKFIEQLSKSVNDYDFIEDFKKHHLMNFSKEINEHIQKVNSSMISNGKLFEGYKNKMREMSGIILPNKNIR
jgi:hypothetical protein